MKKCDINANNLYNDSCKKTVNYQQIFTYLIFSLFRTWWKMKLVVQKRVNKVDVNCSDDLRGSNIVIRNRQIIIDFGEHALPPDHCRCAL